MLSFTVDENLTLELPQPQHAVEITQVVSANIERLEKWMPWAASNYNVDSARTFIEANLSGLADSGSFAMLIRCNGEFAGMIGFHDLDHVNRSAHIGYWISKDFEGQGIMTRCCRFLIDHLFEDFGLNRIQINCNVDNKRSRAIPERLGFQFEGIHRQAQLLQARFADLAAYAILRSEWGIRESENAS